MELYVKVALKYYKTSISTHGLPIVESDEIISSSALKYPSKITRWGNLFAVSDSGNHRIIIFNVEGVVKVILLYIYIKFKL